MNNEFLFDEDNKNVNIEQDKNIRKKHKLYISFRMRVILASILTTLFLFCSIFLILGSFSIVKLESIN